MKRIIALILAMVTMFSLVGCGGGNGGEKTKSSDNKVIWVCYGPNVRDIASVQKAINEYIADKIDVEIEMLVFSSTEYVEKLQMMIASNERVDLCFSASHKNFGSNVSKGFYKPMDEYFDEYRKDVKELYPDYVYTSGIIDDTMYALPAWKDFSYEYSIGYGIEGAEELGMNPDSIKSLADLEPYFEKFKEKYPNSFPCGITSVYNFFCTLGYIPVMEEKTVGSLKIGSDDGKIVNPYETEEAMELMKLMHRWYEKGYIRNDVATFTDNIELNTGNALVCLSQMLPYQREVANKSLSDSRKGGDIKLWDPWLVSTAGSMQSIPKTAKNPEGAMKFLNLLNTDKELRNLVAHGIEGTHYEKVDEWHFKYPDGKKRDDMDYYTWPYTQGNVYLTMQIEDTPDDIYEKYQEFDDNAVRAQNFGFTFNGENLKTEIAAVGNVYSEFIPALVTGAVDPEEYLPKALEKFKAAGLDTILEEMQKQFDEWKASQK